MSVEQQTRALLALVEDDRARQCSALLGDARSKAAALLRQAHDQARSRMRQTFAEQQARQHEQVAAAQARLATQRRLQAQQHTAALLQRAWAQLPLELLALWQQPPSRAAWAAQVLASARARLPVGVWRVLHAPDWPPAEQQALAAGWAAALPTPPASLAGQAAAEDATGLRFEADLAIRAGLKVVANGNVIDGTLAGLLADRAEFEAQLLRQWETSALQTTDLKATPVESTPVATSPSEAAS